MHAGIRCGVFYWLFLDFLNFLYVRKELAKVPHHLIKISRTVFLFVITYLIVVVMGDANYLAMDTQNNNINKGYLQILMSEELSKKQYDAAVKAAGELSFDHPLSGLLKHYSSDFFITTKLVKDAHSDRLIQRREAITASALIDGKNVVSTAFSRKSKKVTRFLEDSLFRSKKVGRMISAGVRQQESNYVDSFAVTSCGLELRTFKDGNYNLISEQEVSPPCKDYVVRNSGGSEIVWLFRPDELAAEAHLKRLDEANRWNEIACMLKYGKRSLSEVEKEEFFRLSAKGSVPMLGEVEISAESNSSPVAKEAIDIEALLSMSENRVEKFIPANSYDAIKNK